MKKNQTRRKTVNIGDVVKSTLLEHVDYISIQPRWRLYFLEIITSRS